MGHARADRHGAVPMITYREIAGGIVLALILWSIATLALTVLR